MANDLSRGDWLELAKIRNDRMQERSSTEWNLWVSHLGALGVFVLGISTQLRPELQQNHAVIVTVFVALPLVLSFLINWKWISLIQDGHAFDAAMFRYYMDKASSLLTADVIETEARQGRDRIAALEYAETLRRSSQPSREFLLRLPRVPAAIPPRPEDVPLSQEQHDWKGVHWNSALLVHCVAGIVVLSVAYNRSENIFKSIVRLITDVVQ